MSDIPASEFDGVTASPTDAAPYQFRKTGTVRLRFPNGGAIDLRRPNLGEYRKLRESYYDLLDDNSDEAERVQRQNIADQERSDGLDADDPERSDLRRAIRQRTRDYEHAVEQRRYDWLAMVVGTIRLGQAVPMPSMDEMDPALIAPEFAGRLMGHLSSVPLDSGAS